MTDPAANGGALAAVVAAWDALPGGYRYNTAQIQSWLLDHMKPAIDAARAELAREPSPNSSAGNDPSVGSGERVRTTSTGIAGYVEATGPRVAAGAVSSSARGSRADLPRYGLQWNGPREFVATPMPDGYWTPWHLASQQPPEPGGSAEIWSNEYLASRLRKMADQSNYGTLEEVGEALLALADDFTSGCFSRETRDDAELALAMSRLVHDECTDVPHDIGLRLAALVPPPRRACDCTWLVPRTGNYCPGCGGSLTGSGQPPKTGERRDD